MTDPIRFKLGLAGGLITDAEGDWITYRTHVAAIARLTYERDEWREADRAECEENRGLVEQLKGCSATIVQYHSEFSRLDYALGAPNDNQCSLYDVDCDETRVVDAAIARLAEAERTIARLSGFTP